MTGSDPFQWPEPGSVNHWLWVVPTLEGLLDVRELAIVASQKYPGCKQDILAIRDPAPLFEMSGPHVGFIPANTEDFEPPNWLQKKGANKKFLSLLNSSSTVGFVRSERAKQFAHLSALSFCHIDRAESLIDQEKIPHLQAGASSLAAATHFYRGLAPNALKLTIVLDASIAGFDPQVAIQGAQALVPAEQDLAQRLKMPLITTVLLTGDPDKLTQRMARSHCPDHLQVGLQGLIGHLAYSDRVVASSPFVTRLVRAMGREDALVL